MQWLKLSLTVIDVKDALIAGYQGILLWANLLSVPNAKAPTGINLESIKKSDRKTEAAKMKLKTAFIRCFLFL